MHTQEAGWLVIAIKEKFSLPLDDGQDADSSRCYGACNSLRCPQKIHCMSTHKMHEHWFAGLLGFFLSTFSVHTWLLIKTTIYSQCSCPELSYTKDKPGGDIPILYSKFLYPTRGSEEAYGIRRNPNTCCTEIKSAWPQPAYIWPEPGLTYDIQEGDLPSWGQRRVCREKKAKVSSPRQKGDIVR